MRKLLAVAFIVLVAVVFLNDVGRWVNAQSAVNERSTRLAQWASDNIRSGNASQNSLLVAEEGARLGVRVDQYEETADEARLSCSADVPGTWVIGPYVAVLNGTPLDQALSSPFVVRSTQVARLQ